MLGLEELAGQVALSVDDAGRLARGAAGERDQTRIARLEVDGAGRLGGSEECLVRDREHRAGRVRGRKLREVALVGDDQARLGGLDAHDEVVGAQLLVTGQRHRADPEAGHHGQHPLGPVADQRHHDVPPGHAVDPAQCAGQPRTSIGHLGEAPLAPAPVTGHLDQGGAVGRRGLDDVAGEVHGGGPVCQHRPA